MALLVASDMFGWDGYANLGPSTNYRCFQKLMCLMSEFNQVTVSTKLG